MHPIANCLHLYAQWKTFNLLFGKNIFAFRGAGMDGGLIFIALAIVAAAGIWADSRREQQQHETLRLLIEKTGEADEEKINALFRPKHGGFLHREHSGKGYRFLRVLGSIVMFVASAGIIIMLIARLFPLIDMPPLEMIFLWVWVFVLGAGIFFSSRFTAPPKSDNGHRSGNLSKDE